MPDPAHIATLQHPLGDKPDVQHTVRKARPWAERFGRYGFGTRGAVYLLVATIALLQATGFRQGALVSGRSALLLIAEQPLGTVMLIGIAIGFFGFGVWQLFSGLFLPIVRRRSLIKMIFKRFARVCSGIAQFTLSAGAIGLIIGARRETDDTAAVGWTAWLMDYTFGRVVVLGIGIGIGIFGVTQIYKGWRKKFPQQLDPSELRNGLHTFVTRLGQFGLMARGIVFGIVGVFLIHAAIDRNPHEARGLGGAMHALEMQPYGPWLLGVVAIGLFGYGLYLLIGSRYCAFRLD
jgi:hypothetical protein